MESVIELECVPLVYGIDINTPFDITLVIHGIVNLIDSHTRLVLFVFGDDLLPSLCSHDKIIIGLSDSFRELRDNIVDSFDLDRLSWMDDIRTELLSSFDGIP